MARIFEYVLHFVKCVTVTVSPNQIIDIINNNNNEENDDDDLYHDDGH